MQELLKDPITVYRERDGWQPVFPLRTEGPTSVVSLACRDAERRLKAKLKELGKITENVESSFHLKGDVASILEVDGLHIVPNSDARYKLKVSLKLPSGEAVEAGFTFDNQGCASLNEVLD